MHKHSSKTVVDFTLLNVNSFTVSSEGIGWMCEEMQFTTKPAFNSDSQIISAQRKRDGRLQLQGKELLSGLGC